ncbi:MAG: Fic family protein [Eggerthellaceae bacterium]|nr:Fic family protein [Eggerthellaceae bacterium]
MVDKETYSYEDDERYVYDNTDVLVNLFDIKDWAHLSEIERSISGVRYAELEELPIEGAFNLEHLCAIHRHLFGDIYPWAGKVRAKGFIAKGNSLFCSPEFIIPYSDELFRGLKNEKYLKELDRDKFINRLAFYIAEINALHPFREGNGRTQRAFINQLARNAGWELNFSDINPNELREAYIESMHISTEHIERLLDEHVTPAR